MILRTGRGRHRKYPPYALTEHGALMAATILNSPRAVAMSVYIIRAFVKLRENQVADAAILKRLAEIDKTLLLHDSALRDIYQKLLPLLEPPLVPPKPEIGFHVKDEVIPYRVKTRLCSRAFQTRQWSGPDMVMLCPTAGTWNGFQERVGQSNRSQRKLGESRGVSN